MPLTTISSLRVINEPSEADRLVDVALNQLEAVAEDHFSGRNFTIRDLVPSDMPGNSNNEWTEASGGSDNEYATTALPVTTLRFTVGASLRAQVDLHEIVTLITGGTAAGGPLSPRKGFLMSPLIITSQQVLKIEEYVTATTGTYQMYFHGFIAEIQGKTLEA